MRTNASRRDFLERTALAGGALALARSASASADRSSEPLADPEAALARKVQTAMLAMQRRAWEQGVAGQALLERGETDLVVLFAKDALVNQAKDGRLGLNGDRAPVTDPASNGEPVLAAYRATGDAAFKLAADRMLEFLLHQAPRTSKGLIFHNQAENRIWVDSFYMAPPFLAVAGHPDEAVRQVEGYRETLRSPGKGAYFHIWDEARQRFERKLLWGVGNGWAAAGMTRVIRALPDAMRSDRERISGYVRELLDACLKFQREDGLFHDVLDDPSTFVETNAAQMLAYSIYRGVRGGWIPPSYTTHADRMRKAAHAKVDRYGLVQGVCGAPNFDRPGTATEGQAFFLLMEAAHGPADA
jgi:unsaturated rhamnogalacturonyl hydrolase